MAMAINVRENRKGIKNKQSRVDTNEDKKGDEMAMAINVRDNRKCTKV
jgi:hypothetical protein